MFNTVHRFNTCWGIMVLYFLTCIILFDSIAFFFLEGWVQIYPKYYKIMMLHLILFANSHSRLNEKIRKNRKECKNRRWKDGRYNWRKAEFECIGERLMWERVWLLKKYDGWLFSWLYFLPIRIARADREYTGIAIKGTACLYELEDTSGSRYGDAHHHQPDHP